MRTTRQRQPHSFLLGVPSWSLEERMDWSTTELLPSTWSQRTIQRNKSRWLHSSDTPSIQWNCMVRSEKWLHTISHHLKKRSLRSHHSQAHLVHRMCSNEQTKRILSWKWKRPNHVTRLWKRTWRIQEVHRTSNHGRRQSWQNSTQLRLPTNDRPTSTFIHGLDEQDRRHQTHEQRRMGNGWTRNPQDTYKSWAQGLLPTNLDGRLPTHSTKFWCLVSIRRKNAETNKTNQSRTTNVSRSSRNSNTSRSYTTLRKGSTTNSVQPTRTTRKSTKERREWYQTYTILMGQRSGTTDPTTPRIQGGTRGLTSHNRTSNHVRGREVSYERSTSALLPETRWGHEKNNPRRSGGKSKRAHTPPRAIQNNSPNIGGQTTTNEQNDMATWINQGQHHSRPESRSTMGRTMPLPTERKAGTHSHSQVCAYPQRSVQEIQHLPWEAHHKLHRFLATPERGLQRSKQDDTSRASQKHSQNGLQENAQEPDSQNNHHHQDGHCTTQVRTLGSGKNRLEKHDTDGYLRLVHSTYRKILRHRHATRSSTTTGYAIPTISTPPSALHQTLHRNPQIGTHQTWFYHRRNVTHPHGIRIRFHLKQTGGYTNAEDPKD